MRDLYKILGVDEDADEATIAKAYKALAKRLHPDLNPSIESGPGKDAATATDGLRDVIEAYKVLSNPDERAAYDAAQNQGRARLYRRILLATVLTIAASISVASLSAAYYWRAEVLAERRQPALLLSRQEQIAAITPVILELTAPSKHSTIRASKVGQAVNQPDELAIASPDPVPAPSPIARELPQVTGPLRVAYALSALLGTRAGEVVGFTNVSVADADTAIDSGRRPDDPVDVATRPPLANNAKSEQPEGDSASPPLPIRPPRKDEQNAKHVLSWQQAKTLVETQYLSSGRRNRRKLMGLYCYKVDYWGEKATSRTSVVNQIGEFAGRWPHRSYKLTPGSLDVAPTGRRDSYRVEFTYQFRVATSQSFGGAAGIARGQLVFQYQHGRWRVCSEKGKVLQRVGPFSAIPGKHAPKFAGGPNMDAQLIPSAD